MLQNFVLSVLLVGSLNFAFTMVAAEVQQCNGTVPEHPGPLCGPPAPKCSGYSSAACPLVGTCGDALGRYRDKLPKECEDGAPLEPDPMGNVPPETRRCGWADDDQLCYVDFACKYSAGDCVQNGPCTQASDSYRVEVPCTPPGP
jgi:hypothetical protein